jgi:hypothetical protein
MLGVLIRPSRLVQTGNAAHQELTGRNKHHLQLFKAGFQVASFISKNQ